MTTTPSSATTDIQPRYALAVALSYRDHPSDKIHDTVLAGTFVSATWGRRIARNPQRLIKTFATPDDAARHAWATLHSKLGKGYHVDSATVVDLATYGTSPATLDRGTVDRIAGHFTGSRYLTRSSEGTEHRGATLHDYAAGAALLRALTTGDPGEQLMLEAVCAPYGERFLPSLVLAHPACPDTARTAAALAAGPRRAA